MLDHDVAAVVGSARRLIRVDHFPLRDCAHFVERLAARIAAHRSDIHPFVESV